MLSHVWSNALQGIEALPIEIETHIETGIPSYNVVGLPDNAVRESRERIWAALTNTGLPRPRGAITINLAPADVRKEGSAFDLPIAVGLLAVASESIAQERLDELMIMGELALDGTLRPVRGILPMVIQARAQGKHGVLVPEGNASEAAVVEGVSVYPIAKLTDAFNLLTGCNTPVQPVRQDTASLLEETGSYPIDFADVCGQENVKRGLEVAAAGGHNVLMMGPPGAGKTMLARRMPTILPPLTPDEALETTQIHSVGGYLKGRAGLITTRPYRAPHHTISDVGLCGGGSNPMPGEISLAHNGILFLDELPEFKRSVLEVLRQPLEEGHITISRARCRVDYPARFMLVAGMNPCPCGYLNDPRRECVCTPSQVQRYLGRVSGPLMDRIDLHIEVTPVPFEHLDQERGAVSSADVRTRVVAARKLQAVRFHDQPHIYSNAHMGARLVRTHCRLDEQGKHLMKTAIHRLGLSARAYDRILKVARTIADLAGSGPIETPHLSEAIQYRSREMLTAFA